MAAEQERRRKHRYQHGNLSVRVRRWGVLGKLQKEKVVDWMDFNRNGMAFETDRRYGLSTRLVVCLHISDVREVGVPEVLAEVRNISDQSGRYRYGVKFDCRDTPQMGADDIQRSLDDIEILLGSIFKRLASDSS